MLSYTNWEWWAHLIETVTNKIARLHFLPSFYLFCVFKKKKWRRRRNIAFRLRQTLGIPFTEYTNLSYTKIRLAPLEFTIAKPFSPITSAVIPPRKSKSPEVVGRLSGVTAHVNPQPFPVFHQSGRWSMGIKCETTQIWCASRYIILCMYYLHSLYSSHRSLLCLASRGFRTPPEPEPEAGPNLKPSCHFNTNQTV